MKDFKWLSVLFITLIVTTFTSCRQAVPEFTGVDIEAWHNDKNACNGIRAAAIPTLQAQRKNFLGLTEMEIVEVFGKPDINELYKRNQKFYYYYLEPSSHCATPDSSALRLAIRFNAMGLAKEISLE